MRFGSRFAGAVIRYAPHCSTSMEFSLTRRELVSHDIRTSLLDTLRECIGLTSAKKGCDHDQCGACTVHVGGEPKLDCLTLTVAVEVHDVTTIEGLAASRTIFCP